MTDPHQTATLRPQSRSQITKIKQLTESKTGIKFAFCTLEPWTNRQSWRQYPQLRDAMIDRNSAVSEASVAAPRGHPQSLQGLNWVINPTEDLAPPCRACSSFCPSHILVKFPRPAFSRQYRYSSE